jgi:hypothetical protein
MTTLFRDFSSAFRAKNKRQCHAALGAIHSFLLNLETSYKTVDIPLVAPQLIEKLLGLSIREETI